MRGGALTLLLAEDPPSLSIHEETGLSTLWAMSPAYNGLVRYAPLMTPESPASIEPELAERWQLGSDGLSLAFDLRDNVRWHDGEPFTSRDVRFTIDMLRSGEGLAFNPRQVWYSNIESVEAPGEREVVLRLKRPQPSLLALLASGAAPIYPAHVAGEGPGHMRLEVMGTGPFRLYEYIPGEVITLVRNAGYFFPGRPYLEQIDYVIFPDPYVRRHVVESGLAEISLPLDLTAEDAQRIKERQPSFLVQEVASSVSRRLLFNHRREPWSQLAVRQAVSLALNRGAYMAAMPAGAVVVGGPMMPEGIWAPLLGEELLAFDGYGDASLELSAAQTVLGDAGYGGGISATLVVEAGRLAGEVDFVRARLEMLGITVAVREVGPLEWEEVLEEGGFDLALERFILAVDDADAVFYDFYSCGAARNRGGYCNRDAERLIETQSATRNVGLRVKDVHLVQGRLLEDVADVVLGWEVNRVVVSPRVRDWEVHGSPFNNARMQDVWLAQELGP